MRILLAVCMFFAIALAVMESWGGDQLWSIKWLCWAILFGILQLRREIAESKA